MSDISSAYRIFLFGVMTCVRCLSVCVLSSGGLLFMHKNSFPEVKIFTSVIFKTECRRAGKHLQRHVAGISAKRFPSFRHAKRCFPSRRRHCLVSPQSLSCMTERAFPCVGKGFSAPPFFLSHRVLYGKQLVDNVLRVSLKNRVFTTKTHCRCE